MKATEITSPDDPRLVPFSSLRDAVLRDHGGPADRSGSAVGPAAFIAESEEMVVRAAATGHQLIAVLADEGAAGRLAAKVGSDVDMLVAPRSLIEAVSGLGVHRGALALVRRPATLSVDAVIGLGSDVVILEGINNPVNVGLIARSALALGMGGMLLDAESADPLYRRAISASRGATMNLPWARGAAASDLISTATGAEMATFAMTLTEGSTSLDVALRRLGPKVAVVLGNEGAGLSDATQRACSHRVRIAMDGGPGVDSLNVAAAAAIAFHQLRRRRHDLS